MYGMCMQKFVHVKEVHAKGGCANWSTTVPIVRYALGIMKLHDMPHMKPQNPTYQLAANQLTTSKSAPILFRDPITSLAVPEVSTLLL